MVPRVRDRANGIGVVVDLFSRQGVILLGALVPLWTIEGILSATDNLGDRPTCSVPVDADIGSAEWMDRGLCNRIEHNLQWGSAAAGFSRACSMAREGRSQDQSRGHSLRPARNTGFGLRGPSIAKRGIFDRYLRPERQHCSNISAGQTESDLRHPDCIQCGCSRACDGPATESQTAAPLPGTDRTRPLGLHADRPAGIFGTGTNAVAARIEVRRAARCRGMGDADRVD